MKTIIGYLELVNLPGLDLFDLDAKIDTGADASALHCDNLTVNGEMVTFKLHDDVHPAYTGRTITYPIYKTKKVKSSNGESEERICIKASVEIGPEKHTAEISLTNRTNMKYPMLLGRRFLSKGFLVDSSQQYLMKEKQ